MVDINAIMAELVQYTRMAAELSSRPGDYKGRKDLKMKLTKILETIIIAAGLFLLLWMGVSYIEVIIKNLHQNSIYNSWNFFVLFF